DRIPLRLDVWQELPASQARLSRGVQRRQSGPRSHARGDSRLYFAATQSRRVPWFRRRVEIALEPYGAAAPLALHFSRQPQGTIASKGQIRLAEGGGMNHPDLFVPAFTTLSPSMLVRRPRPEQPYP